MAIDMSKSESLQESPKYYEVWGQALDSHQWVKKVLIASALLNVLLVVVTNHALRKPPLVIRVSDIGVAEPVQNFKTEARVTKPEVVSFVKLYVGYFLERSFYTWKENQQKAGAMMTADFRERANRQTNFNEETSAIVNNKLSSKLNLSDITVSRETRDHVILLVKGIRNTTSFVDPQFNKESVFEVELVLKKMPRTNDTPYGLLVDDYKQTTYK